MVRFVIVTARYTHDRTHPLSVAARPHTRAFADGAEGDAARRTVEVDEIEPFGECCQGRRKGSSKGALRLDSPLELEAWRPADTQIEVALGPGPTREL